MVSQSTTSAMEALKNVSRDHATAARSWKERGGKVVGYRCLYVPEEIIWAGGMLPFALYGTPEPIRQADAYLQPCSCEFVRNLFDHALEGSFSFLDHLALCNTCDVVRRIADNWNAYIEGAPVSVLNNPQKMLTEKNREYFTEELRAFKTRMEDLAGRSITDDEIRRAIKELNQVRALLKEINDLRSEDPPRLSGEEMLEITMAATVLPRDEAVRMLREARDEVRERKASEVDGPRLLVTGSILDHPALLKMIEEEGGVVVADDLCTTSRYFWHQADEQGDPLESIYSFMNKRPLCACIHPSEARLEYILELVEHFDVEAVIDMNLKYCHPFLYETPILKKELENRDIPTSVIEVGHDHSGHGQLRTRIQAFIEMLEL